LLALFADTLASSPAQVESGLAVQQLKPTVDLIKRRYGDDKARIQKETAALYEKTGVNPLAGEQWTT
jgi:YidC/Oxa1 family membrane protein insertase